MKKTTPAWALAALLAAAAPPAAAQFAKAEDAIKYRQGALTVLAQHFGPLGGMANGRVPFDAQSAKDNAEVVLLLSRLPWAAFGEGHQGGDARAEIWQEREKFDARAKAFQDAAVKLAAAANAGDLAQLKQAFGAAAATCKQCHDSFKKR